jgi:hypothetical protein
MDCQDPHHDGPCYGASSCDGTDDAACIPCPALIPTEVAPSEKAVTEIKQYYGFPENGPGSGSYGANSRNRRDVYMLLHTIDSLRSQVEGMREELRVERENLAEWILHAENAAPKDLIIKHWAKQQRDRLSTLSPEGE